jgi:uncharacterized protein
MKYPKDSSKIHMFEIENKKFIIDVNNCIFTEIDQIAWDILNESMKVNTKQQIFENLSQKYKIEEIEEAINELETMERESSLFSEDSYLNFEQPTVPPSTLCLNVAQDCDLKCEYCFADEGTYGKGSKRMSFRVAKKAIDFLVAKSKNKHNLTICFFGGEPLLNFQVIKKVVDYTQRIRKEKNKQFRFNITTNGTKLTEKIRKFLAKHNINIIFSIDGPKDIHDKMRRFRNGKGSYDEVSKNLLKLIDDANHLGLNFSIRSTFTRWNFDIHRIATHLVNLGCKDISIEPAITKHKNLEIRKSDLQALKEEYMKFAKIYIDEIKNGNYYSFFHFRHVMDQTTVATRYFNQCGAGNGYLAISSDGEIFPCHRFVGNDDFLMGNIFDGKIDKSLNDKFRNAHVNKKKKCLKCWARYICGGGCHAYAIEYNNNILVPFNIECELMKHRIELGVYVYSELRNQYCDLLENYYQQSKQSRPYMNY